MDISNLLEVKCGKNISDCTNEEIYVALLNLVYELANQKQSNKGKKKLYYISAEFLIDQIV